MYLLYIKNQGYRVLQLMSVVFSKQIGKNLKVYIVDMIVKT